MNWQWAISFALACLTMQCVLWLAAWIVRSCVTRRLRRPGIVLDEETIAALHMLSRWYIVIPKYIVVFIVLSRRAKKERREEHGKRH